ncbi:tetratricopeptide repeat protein [Cryobacterium sp. AP23]
MSGLTVPEHASMLVQAGQLRQAIALLEPHLASEPTDGPAMAVFIAALSGQGRFAEALEVSMRAVALDPDNAAFVVLHAECLVQCGQFAVARQAAALAVQLAPQDYDAHHVHAIALAMLDDFAGAHAAAYQAQLLAEDDDASQANVHILYAVVLERAPGGLPEAMVQARVALTLAPGNEEYRSRLARMLIVAKQPWEAVRVASDVLGVAPTTGSARGALILALLLLQNRLLWFQFGIAVAGPVLAFSVLGAVTGDDGGDVALPTRIGGLITVLLTALVLFLTCHNAPPGRRIARLSWKTIRQFRGAAIALVLQALVAVAAVGAVLTGWIVLLAPAIFVIPVAGWIFVQSMLPMVEAAEKAFGLTEED